MFGGSQDIMEEDEDDADITHGLRSTFGVMLLVDWKLSNYCTQCADFHF